VPNVVGGSEGEANLDPLELFSAHGTLPLVFFGRPSFCLEARSAHRVFAREFDPHVFSL
jgi:hypothetical protein